MESDLLLQEWEDILDKIALCLEEKTQANLSELFVLHKTILEKSQEGFLKEAHSFQALSTLLAKEKKIVSIFEKRQAELLEEICLSRHNQKAMLAYEKK